jgi:uncharacterized protein
MILPLLYLKNIEAKGRGVFSYEALAANTIIEIAPVIVMPLQQKELLDKTLLHDYIFMWGEKEEAVCLALGYASMYNHSYQSNCEYLMDEEALTITIRTVVAIAPHEELTINYNGTVNDETAIWFDAAT